MKYILALLALAQPCIFAKRNHEIEHEDTPVACMVSGITYPDKNHLNKTKKKKILTKHWRQDASQDTSETSEEKAELGSLKKENEMPVVDMPSSIQAAATKAPASENKEISSTPSSAKFVFNEKKRTKTRRASNRDFRRRRCERVIEEEQCTLCSSKEIQPTPVVQASQKTPEYRVRSSALWDEEKAPEQL